MARVGLFLIVVILVSALSTVTSYHRFRNNYNQLEKEKRLTQELGEEYNLLLAKKGKLTRHGEVESAAKLELHMKLPTGKEKINMFRQFF